MSDFILKAHELLEEAQIHALWGKNGRPPVEIASYSSPNHDMLLCICDLVKKITNIRQGAADPDNKSSIFGCNLKFGTPENGSFLTGTLYVDGPSKHPRYNHSFYHNSIKEGTRTEIEGRWLESWDWDRQWAVSQLLMLLDICLAHHEDNLETPCTKLQDAGLSIAHAMHDALENPQRGRSQAQPTTFCCYPLMGSSAYAQGASAGKPKGFACRVEGLPSAGRLNLQTNFGRPGIILAPFTVSSNGKANPIEILRHTAAAAQYGARLGRRIQKWKRPE